MSLRLTIPPCPPPCPSVQVWDISGVEPDAEAPAKLRVTAAVAAHDKDINAVAVAPNDSGTPATCLLVCMGWCSCSDGASWP